MLYNDIIVKGLKNIFLGDWEINFFYKMNTGTFRGYRHY